MGRMKYSKIKVFSQNLSEYKSGAYTGEVSASMLLSIGVENVIIGHQIPAGTGVKFKDVVVGSKIQLAEMQKESVDANNDSIIED